MCLICLLTEIKMFAILILYFYVYLKGVKIEESAMSDHWIRAVVIAIKIKDYPAGHLRDLHS